MHIIMWHKHIYDATKDYAFDGSLETQTIKFVDSIPIDKRDCTLDFISLPNYIIYELWWINIFYIAV